MVNGGGRDRGTEICGQKGTESLKERFSTRQLFNIIRRVMGEIWETQTAFYTPEFVKSKNFLTFQKPRTRLTYA